MYLFKIHCYVLYGNHCKFCSNFFFCCQFFFIFSPFLWSSFHCSKDFCAKNSLSFLPSKYFYLLYLRDLGQENCAKISIFGENTIYFCGSKVVRRRCRSSRKNDYNRIPMKFGTLKVFFLPKDTNKHLKTNWAFHFHILGNRKVTWTQ